MPNATLVRVRGVVVNPPESVKMDVKVIGKIRGPLTPGLSIWFVVGAGWMTSVFI